LNLHGHKAVDGKLSNFCGRRRHAANDRLLNSHAQVHLFKDITGSLASLADKRHIRVQGAVHDVALGDELGVIAQAGVGAVLNQIFSGLLDVTGNDGAADHNVLVRNLARIDLHEDLRAAFAIERQGEAAEMLTLPRKLWS